MSTIATVSDTASSMVIDTDYSDYSGVVERLVICPARGIPSGRAHLGGITQPVIIRSPMPVVSVRRSAGVVGVTTPAHGGFAG